MNGRIIVLRHPVETVPSVVHWRTVTSARVHQASPGAIVPMTSMNARGIRASTVPARIFMDLTSKF